MERVPNNTPNLIYYVHLVNRVLVYELSELLLLLY